MRFVHNLLPQLTAAAAAAAAASSPAGSDSNSGGGGLSRVITVLGAGSEGRLQLDDLSLKTHYSLARTSTHAITMSSLAINELAAAHPNTTFIHSFPGAVNTGLMREFNPLVRGLVSGLMFLLKPLTVPLDECGERHLYAATSGAYPPRAQQQTAGKDIATGADGVTGSGAYLLHWDGSTPNKKAKLLQEYRSGGVAKQVWAHTLEVFEKICSREGGRYD